MHIEALFTPAQQALGASLHKRDQQERRAGFDAPAGLAGRSGCDRPKC